MLPLPEGWSFRVLDTKTVAERVPRQYTLPQPSAPNASQGPAVATLTAHEAHVVVKAELVCDMPVHGAPNLRTEIELVATGFATDRRSKLEAVAAPTPAAHAAPTASPNRVLGLEPRRLPAHAPELARRRLPPPHAPHQPHESASASCRERASQRA